MISVADVNVILPILVANHVLHSVAWAWWESRAEQSVGLCLLVQLGILRLLSNERVMQGQPLSPIDALKVWAVLAEDSRCLWVHPVEDQDRFLKHLVAGRTGSPNLWTDAWISALALGNGTGVTSFARGFESFKLPNFECLRA